MKPIVRVPLFAALAAALLAGCERAPKQAEVEAATQTAAEIADPAPPVTGREAPQFQFSDDEIGIALAPTPGFTLRREPDSAPSEGGWNGLSGPGVRGQPLLRLVLEGSGGNRRRAAHRHQHRQPCRGDMPAAIRGFHCRPLG